MLSIEQIVNSLTLDQLVGQVLCPSISSKIDVDDFEQMAKNIPFGGLYIMGANPEIIKKFTDVVNKYAVVPVIVNTDAEEGPTTLLADGETLPCQMAFGSADDVDLTFRAGKTSAQICRKAGAHWVFNPVVDLNLNFRCPECNVRAFSDDAKHVIKIASAYMKGYQTDGMIACSIKHFPGQGFDERNSHLSEVVNTQNKVEWMKTYGRVYKTLIKNGAMSVMVGHSSLPAFQSEKDEFGYLPATISKSLITDLLKQKLKFDGVVVSDAMCMAGISARLPINRVAVEFIKAGGDMVLFSKKEDFDYVKQAVESGEISTCRLKDAVRRILTMKQKVHLLDENDYFANLQVTDDLAELSQQIANKSIKVVRDYQNAIPQKLAKGDKILLINVIEPFFNKPPKGDEFIYLKQELESNGYIVDYFDNLDYREINRIKNDYKLILINSILSSKNYHGSTMRMGWNTAMVFWDGYVLNHDNVVFVSFGDPYKLYDMPFVKTYVNAFSHFKQSQIAVANVIVGKIAPTGKNPVQFKGFFDREV